MKRPRRTAQRKRFVIIAERHGAEIGRLDALAVNEADALTDGPFDLAKTLGVDLFADDIRFLAILKPDAPPPPQPSPPPLATLDPTLRHQDGPRNAREIIESVRGRAPYRG